MLYNIHEVYSNLACCLHLELLESLLCLGNNDLVTVCHFKMFHLYQLNGATNTFGTFFTCSLKNLALLCASFLRRAVLILL